MIKSHQCNICIYLYKHLLRFCLFVVCTLCFCFFFTFSVCQLCSNRKSYVQHMVELRSVQHCMLVFVFFVNLLFMLSRIDRRTYSFRTLLPCAVCAMYIDSYTTIELCYKLIRLTPFFTLCISMQIDFYLSISCDRDNYWTFSRFKNVQHTTSVQIKTFQLNSRFI